MPPDNYDFNLEKQRAAERLRELNARSKYRQNPVQTECKLKSHSAENRERADSGFLPGINIPFLSDINLDSDLALILGLVLILTSEKSDKLLLLALLYILI